MKIVEKRTLRGPNIYAVWPCLKVIVDLEHLEGVASTDVPLFVERLLDALPSLHGHRCSTKQEGGFTRRLREGTYMAHVVEHVMLELQCLAGSPAGFGRTRRVKESPGLHQVVCAYQIEPLAEAAMDAAMRVVDGLADGKEVDIAAVLATLSDIALRYGIGPSTRTILEAAKARRIPYTRLSSETSLFQLGQGERQHRIQATVTEQTGQIAAQVVGDKQLTRVLLDQAGIPVPRGTVVHGADDAVRAAARLKGAAVIKPADANHGRGVRTGIVDLRDVTDAYAEARRHSRRVIVEQMIEGDDYRILVVAGKMVAASRREAPSVLGDGIHSIQQLIDAENLDPLRGEGHSRCLTRIPVDVHLTERLKRLGMDLTTVLPKGEKALLRDNANLSTGGTAVDVTDDVHPATALACIRAARQVGLDVAGVDLVCRDIRSPLSEQRGAIIEINAAPGIRMHEFPGAGAARPAGRAIVDSLFPAGEDGRIPIVAVTGTNGKTTTTLLVGHTLRLAGLTTGVTTTEGIFVNGEPIKRGDCTGYWSAKTVLSLREVQAAVLETARGGILKRGLGFDRCDVAVVLNVSADHIGQDGVHSLRQLARVKGIVVATARRAAVLNAEDRYCVAMAKRARPGVEILYFSCDPDNAVIQAHLRRGGRAVYAEQDDVVLGGPSGRTSLFGVQNLPVALNGRARHNVANTLAAAAALVALGVCDVQAIVEGLTTFRCTTDENPLRLNLFRVGRVTVMLDYAHNPAAYRAILGTARAMGHRRVVGVVTAPGDRRDIELRQVARVCAEGLDEMIVYEAEEFRGRPPGATAQLLCDAALDHVGGAKPVCVINPVQAAIGHAFQRCQDGDMLLICCASDVRELELALAQASLAATSPVEELKSA
ncbi:cyanophycin synthetase [Parapusillimonas sp. SGNA-6]|nr:cyanophycin synthetase [Parapusillimonas sp. SGNA-6]